MKRYILMETRKYFEFDTKKEAKANLDNLSIFNPENGYEIVEQEVEE